MIFLLLFAMILIVGAVMGFIALVIGGIAVLYDNRERRLGRRP